MPNKIPARFTLIILCFFSTQTFASGFELFEYSAAAVGNANAGGAAIAEDATTGYINPAGLVWLPGQQLVISATGIWAEADFHGQACGGLFCHPGHTSKNGGGFVTIPSLAYALPLNEQFSLGLNIGSPFGLQTDYGDRGPVSYSASASEVTVVMFNPSLAFKINNKWSIGAGAIAQSFSATLNSELNFFPGIFADTAFKNTVDGWGYGWNAGVLYQMTEQTRLGASFISQVTHHADGSSELEGGIIPTFQSRDAYTNITLPATAIFSVYHTLNPQWAIMGSAIYTHWDSIDQIVLHNAALPTLTLTSAGPQFGTTTGTAILPQAFDNTWRVSFGVDYQITPQWRLRAGAGYDQTPTNNTDRTLRLPDGDRVIASAGAQYKINEQVRLDAGYSHYFIEDGSIHQVSALAQTVGSTDNAADLLGLQLTWDIA